ncbi:hypothetical protein K227x_36930 [Rubripirellula lacrimiformis]|uniref:Uncharacterized protein n=1 Tax=Rubripirellula lacrimiformis TaxID=1930273 RepID=A0A517NDT6_9BACT|nr:hypothetical protein [Rubripirellula lacrimiformis]QDT05293.1 hypothetical protein K227x_36930 [Rubripirellula lacrimiformis]
MVFSNVATALAVNSAFLQEIKDSNPDLWAAADQLRVVLGSGDDATAKLRRTTRLLDQIRDGLALQFSLEESYGYLTVGQPKCERESELATIAQSQHAPLYLSLCDLVERAEELQYRGVQPLQMNELVGQIYDFDRQWQAHEQIEADLIGQSF